MDLTHASRKDIGALGERVAADYLRRHGLRIVDRNVARKTGELDIIARGDDTLHFVEVKSMLCKEFPSEHSNRDEYDPSVNLHPHKVRKVARTAQWYAAEIDWEGDWQVDGVLVWLRERDGRALVHYLPQIL